MKIHPVTFAANAESAFGREIRREVADYFAQRRLSQKADPAMVVKSIAMVLLTFVPYALILSNRVAPWAMLLLAVLMGIGYAGLGFCIGHDAVHGAYSRKSRINRLLATVFDIQGASSDLWKLTHNAIHHNYTNITQFDEDIEIPAPFLRISPTAPRYAFHRFQHIYGWLLYTLTTLNWIFVQDFLNLRARNLGPYRDIRHKRAAIWKFFGFKLLHVTWTLAIPLLVVDLPVWQILLGYLVVHMVAGWIMGVVFQMAHIVDAAQFVTLDDNDHVGRDRFAHQLHTTADFAIGNRLLTWYVGGLNHQIEHHLFPGICSVHYPRLREIVRDAAARHRLPYHSYAGVWAAMAAHGRVLRENGKRSN